MKHFFIVATFVLSSVCVCAQDVILKKDSTVINAEIVEITEQQIKYKDTDLHNRLTRHINISEVLTVTYENGRKEVFNKPDSSKKETTLKKEVSKTIARWLRSMGINSTDNYYINWILFAIWVLLSYFLFYGIYRLAIFFVKKYIKRAKSALQQALLDKKLYRRIFYILTLIFINATIRIFFRGNPDTVRFLSVVLELCFVVAICSIFISVVNAIEVLYSLKKGSIKSITQAIKTVILILSAIVMIGLLLNVPLSALLGTLAGASAIMMLIFKDSILGLVAGIQLTVNKMVLPGDWIEMPSADADGNVTEISLISVKVQNWDNTITTIPAYDLVTKAVKNWRGMSASGGRRIKRYLYIDMTSVHFCSPEMLDNLRKIQFLSEYITQKEVELARYNADTVPIDQEVEVNGRHLTNLGIFRIYVQRYLENNPSISRDFTLMVRQLQPTNYGIPIEIYCFTSTTQWLTYEKIQCDIFDHIIASMDYFDLRLFQTPSWNDYRKRYSPSSN